MDIPRIFTIMESAHRIHNPFTAEKYETLGAARSRPSRACELKYNINDLDWAKKGSFKSLRTQTAANLKLPQILYLINPKKSRHQ